MTPLEIKEALEKSGYLFEQRVASVIENLGFHVETNKAYLDPEENKSREIDVLAHKISFEIENKATGICYINCECKNTTTPFVFITRKKGFFDKLWVPDGIFLPYNKYYKEISRNTVTELNAFYYMQLETSHFAVKEEMKAVQLCKIIQNNKKFEAQHSGVIEGFIYPLIKSKKVWEEQAPKSNEKKKYCKFFFNLAVVNSKLYTVNSDLTDPIPTEVNYVPFVREIRTNEIDGRFLITFVTFEYLQQFIINNLELFCKDVYDKLIEKPELIESQYIYLQ